MLNEGPNRFQSIYDRKQAELETWAHNDNGFSSTPPMLESRKWWNTSAPDLRDPFQTSLNLTLNLRDLQFPTSMCNMKIIYRLMALKNPNRRLKLKGGTEFWL